MLDPISFASVVSDAKRAKFSDVRLATRLSAMTRKLAAEPSRSFPKVFTSAELEGAYRFFGNPLVTPEVILSGHFEGTRAAVDAAPTVLVVHDSSTFAFNPDGERKGLGRVRERGQAFFAHVSLVLSDDGTRRPLGLAGLTTWIRGEERSGNEKARWWESVRLSTERLGHQQNLIHVMDREADDYALFMRLCEGQHRFVIRLAHDRRTAESTRNVVHKISDAVAELECVVQREASLSKRNDGARSPKQKGIHPARGTRKAILAIGATVISLQRPSTQKKELPLTLTLHVVRVWEPAPPEGEAPIEWTLLTTEPIDSPTALLRIVDRYRARWTIEEYFKVIKTGCAFPERQLGDYEGLINALAVFAPIACRLLALRSDAHHQPELPATQVLDPLELQVLRELGRVTLPPQPSVRDALLAVAALGGHIKGSGEPGWLTLSRGFSDLQILSRAWRAAKIQQSRDQR